MKVGSSPITPQSLHRTLAIAALCRDVWRATRPALSRRSSCGKHGLTVRGEIGGIHLALGEVVISNEHTWELWRARRVAGLRRSARCALATGSSHDALSVCWIRTRQAMTDPPSDRQPRRRRSRRWQRRSRRKRVILIIGSIVVFALAILAVMTMEWLLDLVVK